MDEFEKKYPEYADLMPIRESIYKLNRLEGLQQSIRLQQRELGINGLGKGKAVGKMTSVGVEIGRASCRERV